MNSCADDYPPLGSAYPSAARMARIEHERKGSEVSGMLTNQEWEALTVLGREVPMRVAEGKGYAWGRQDASGGRDVQDTIASLRFAIAWAQRWHDYQRERQHYVPNIQTAYNAWLATGAIR